MKAYFYFAVAILFSFTAGAKAQLVYQDVPASHWAKNAIDWVTQKQIMTGPAGPNATFAPDQTLTRAELAVVVTRTYALTERRIDELELKIAQLENEGFLLEELLEKGSSVLQNR